MIRKILALVSLLAAGSAAACAAQDITLAAAASLTDSLLQLQDQMQTSVGAQVFVNVGSSGTLRRQIEQGAPVDVFFAASGEDMDVLVKEGLVLSGTRKDVLRNSLVVIGDPNAKAVTGAEDLKSRIKSAKNVAIGNPDAVPAGRYAVEALKKYGAYDLAQNKLSLGGSVREVIQYVQNGFVPLGFVFLTDVLSARPAGSVVSIFRFPAETFSAPIVYPIAVTASSKSRVNAQKLVEFLRSKAARDVFSKAGFQFP
jgi:molybdate transport system substrate-binding protein